VKHGRLVAVVLSARAFNSLPAAAAGVAGAHDEQWGKKHMIPPELARAARVLKYPNAFDEE
jgi:hypothetical protein